MTKTVFFDTKLYERDYFSNSDIFNENEVLFFSESLLNPKKIPEESLNSDVISVFTSSRLTGDILSNFHNLKLIITRSVGYSHIDTDYCISAGIKLVTTPHYGDNTVAEFAFGLLLNLVRKISKAMLDVKNGEINKNYMGVELTGKTIGIFGTGAIGKQSVRIADGFDMKILAVDVYPDEELTKNYNLKYTDVDTMCKNSDFIFLHAPLTKENFHIFNEEKLALMKKSVIIVNTARGELIDTNALYNALYLQKIGGAALDVIECEEFFSTESDLFNDESENCSICLKKTLLNHALLNLKNTIITPHIAYDTKDATDRILKKTVLNLQKFLQNENLPDQLYLHK